MPASVSSSFQRILESQRVLPVKAIGVPFCGVVLRGFAVVFALR